MIFTENGRVKIDGTCSEILMDATCILHIVYQTLSDAYGSDAYGKEMVNKMLVDVCRLAVMTDEELDEELEKMIMDLEMR